MVETNRHALSILVAELMAIMARGALLVLLHHIFSCLIQFSVHYAAEYTFIRVVSPHLTFVMSIVNMLFILAGGANWTGCYFFLFFFFLDLIMLHFII